MVKKRIKKITTVHEHPMHVPPSKKNPLGSITTRHQHPRRIYTSYTVDDIRKITKNADLKKIIYPTPNKLKFPEGNKYDQLIAIWVDYFNKIFPPKPPFALFDPNVIKALIASESKFKQNPKGKAIGIAQIMPSTCKILQNPNGEVTDHLFKEIRQKDLIDPEIGIPVGIRWLFYKKTFVEQKLKRAAIPEEIIMSYKGLSKSRTDYQKSALKNFRDNYEELTRKK